MAIVKQRMKARLLLPSAYLSHSKIIEVLLLTSHRLAIRIDQTIA